MCSFVFLYTIRWWRGWKGKTRETTCWGKYSRHIASIMSLQNLCFVLPFNTFKKQQHINNSEEVTILELKKIFFSTHMFSFDICRDWCARRLFVSSSGNGSGEGRGSQKTTQGSIIQNQRGSRDGPTSRTWDYGGDSDPRTFRSCSHRSRCWWDCRLKLANTVVV